MEREQPPSISLYEQPTWADGGECKIFPELSGDNGHSPRFGRFETKLGFSA